MTLDQINAESAYWFAIAKECLAKTWWNAEPNHPAVYRSLKIDPTDPAAWYAAAPFRVAKVGAEHVILAAWPAPRMLSDYPEDWLEIEDVIVWRPNAGTIETPEDVEPRLIGAWPDRGANTLFGTPFAFFRAWAEERAAFFTAWKAAKDAHWLAAPVETSSPGMLAVGDLKRMRLPIASMPQNLECIGIDPREVNKAIMRAARLPRAGQSLRAAA